MRMDLGIILCVLLEYIIMVYYTNTSFYPRKSYLVSNLITLGGYALLPLAIMFGNLLLNQMLFVVVNFVVLFAGYRIGYKNVIFQSLVLSIISAMGELMVSAVLEIGTDTSSVLNISLHESMIITIIGKLIYFIGVVIIKGIVKGKKHEIDTSYVFLIIIPILTLICIFEMIGIEMEKSTFLLLSILLFVINIVVFIVNDIIKSNRTQINILQQENNRNKAELTEYQMMSDSYEKTRIMRHDFKEQINMLKTLIREDNNKAQQFVQDMQLKQKELNVEKYSDNKILNVLLNQKVKECNEHGIEIQIRSTFPQIDFISDIDIVAIFSNLINNAIESCDNSLRKEIYMSIYSINNAFTAIKIENSADVEPVIINDIMVTSKPDKTNHGFGMKSISKALKNYNGEIRQTYDKNNQIFRTIIMINVENYVKM